jgi:hypothetical protein
MIRAVLLALLIILPTAAFAGKSTAADRAWIAACVRQLKDEPAPRRDTKWRYCACMHEPFDDNQPASQNDMEHMYPPLHRACLRKAGWK